MFKALLNTLEKKPRTVFVKLLWAAMTVLTCLCIVQGRQFNVIVLCLLMLLLQLDELTDRVKEAVAHLKACEDKKNADPVGHVIEAPVSLTVGETQKNT